jgi:hypothetical protein
MMLTAFRDFRDNFSTEIWTALGHGNSPSIYTKTEIPVAIGVLVLMASVMLVRNNKKALMVNHLIIMAGMILIGMSTLLFQQNIISPTLWMILTGFGLYMGYVPFNSIFFDRMLATFRYAGTVGFIMYVADAFGYLGSIGVLLIREFLQMRVSWLNFFVTFGYFLSLTGTVLIFFSMVYFHGKYKKGQVISRVLQ